MAADARIYVFDYWRYRVEVVPALVRLMHTGEPVPWPGAVIEGATTIGEYGNDVLWARMAARFTERPTTWSGTARGSATTCAIAAPSRPTGST